jgi:putative NIF3 family GTP cyclohydrolase 1 type 2
MTHLSRREFAALAAAAAAAPFNFTQTPPGTSPIAAAELIARIKDRIGVEWKADSVDGVKAGDPATPVTGVVTTALATLAVLRRAVKAGANVVIASQPAFYSRTDARTPPAGRGGRGGAPAGGPPQAGTADITPPADPVFAAKNAFIDEHKLVLVRLSEHWRLRQPDPLALGMAQAMEWTKYQAGSDPRRYDVPAATVGALVASIATRLGARGGIRLVGQPDTIVRRVGLLPGSTPIQASLAMLPNVDAIVAGEVREWESVEYARDMVFTGEKKALILVGRIVSEEPGMRACAEWLKSLVPGVPSRHIAAGDPYWRPAR